MNIDSALREPWLIAAVTFVATVAIVPLVTSIINIVRSLFGPFTGRYLALTWPIFTRSILVEEVNCRHIGKRLTGRIHGVANVEIIDDPRREVKEISDNAGRYRFNGFVKERLLVVSYTAIARSAHSAGSISLDGDDAGEVFTGEWAGTVNTGVESARCIWVKLSPPISSARDRDAFMSHTKKLIAALENQDLQPPIPTKVVQALTFSNRHFKSRVFDPSTRVSERDTNQDDLEERPTPRPPFVD